MANPYVNKVIVNGVSRLDLTSDTVAADKLLTGYTAHNAAGAAITGSYSPPSLSLTVVAYESSFPSTADENTIGFISSTDVSGYRVSGTQPTTELTEGLVWIIPGAESSCSIPLNEDGTILFYPIGLKQYISGAWTSFDGKVYQSSSWVALRKYLFNEGDTCGFTYTDGAGHMDIEDGKIIIDGTVRCCASPSVNLTDYSTLCVDYTLTGYASAQPHAIGFNNTYSTTNAVPDATYVAVASGATRATLSVSYTDNKYLKFYFANGNEGYIYRIWLEA